MTVLLILLCGIFDRMRGFHWRFMSFFYGTSLAFLAGIHEWKLVVSFSLLWWLGAAPGWGEPLGSFFSKRPQNPLNKEWWQILGLQNPGMEIPATAFRGLMWGGCLLPLAYWIPNLVWAPIVGAFGITVAVPLTWALAKVVKLEGWAIMEFIRGLIIGLGIFLVS